MIRKLLQQQRIRLTPPDLHCPILPRQKHEQSPSTSFQPVPVNLKLLTQSRLPMALPRLMKARCTHEHECIRKAALEFQHCRSAP
ncbi:MAG: hypothetical protein [Caudoviricetes sp.]|nr:MAG: hypothetical protein [Caudoviricetes sp.]